MNYDVSVDGKAHRLELARKAEQWECKLGGRLVPVDVVMLRRNVMSLLINGVSYEVRREHTVSGLRLSIGTKRYAVELKDPRSLHSRRAESGSTEGKKKVIAPMPGKIVRVMVQEKMEVQAGQGVVVVEAMKMQNELKSPKQGIVQKVMAVEGANVNAGDVLLIVE